MKHVCEKVPQGIVEVIYEYRGLWAPGALRGLPIFSNTTVLVCDNMATRLRMLDGDAPREALVAVRRDRICATEVAAASYDH